jgi:hypothetical protein
MKQNGKGHHICQLKTKFALNGLFRFDQNWQKHHLLLVRKEQNKY